MINPSEHVYDDDPNLGHPDVRTRLRDVSYFFIGNGYIQAAVQWAPSGEGTPLGLLLMDPDRLRKKRDALTMDRAGGLEATLVRVEAGGARHHARADATHVAWTTRAGVPAVEAVWNWDGGEVTEIFFCPDTDSPRLVREVRVRCSSGNGPIRISTSAGGSTAFVEGEPRGDPACFAYDIVPGSGRVDLRVERMPVADRARARWERASRFTFADPMLDRFARISQYQLAAAKSAAGRMDASIWQYNREWVRDQAFVAIGFLMAGDREGAACLLDRLLREFITAEGGAMDSSEVRSPDEAELDQNGVLLYALEEYVRWTGDVSLVSTHWPRIQAAAEYPLRPQFTHRASGLLSNTREFWERHRLHGIKPGLELVHQIFVSIGLRAAASLAVRMRQAELATRWASDAERLRAAALSHPTYGFVVNGTLVKRMNLDGTVQDRIDPRPDSLMPVGAPLLRPGDHWLNPDTCVALPIAARFIAPDSLLARRTLDSVEPLWNQEWEAGGYGRYHASSEPDSPGGWPFASIFVARASVEAGVPDRAWRVLRWLNEAPGAPAGSWFEFYGPRASPPYPQVGIVPWTWSEMLALLVGHILGVRPEADDLTVRPLLLPGLDHAAGRMRYGSGILTVNARREAGRTPVARVKIAGRLVAERASGEVSVAGGSSLGDDIEIDIVLPRE
jgi:hypothetical protein